MRHADAEPGRPGLPDLGRVLTGRGVSRAAMRRDLVEGLRPQVILCSSAVRARQTLEELSLSPGNRQVLFEDGLYSASATALLSRVAEVSPDIDRLLVIGHMPTVAVVVRALTTDYERDLVFAPAAVAVLRLTTTWADLKPSSATLESLTT